MEEQLTLQLLEYALEDMGSYVVVHRSERIEYSVIRKTDQIINLLDIDNPDIGEKSVYSLENLSDCSCAISAMSNGIGGIIIVGNNAVSKDKFVFKSYGSDRTNSTIDLYPFSISSAQVKRLINVYREILTEKLKGNYHFDIKYYQFNEQYYLYIIVFPSKGRYVYFNNLPFFRKNFYSINKFSEFDTKFPDIKIEREVFSPTCFASKNYVTIGKGSFNNNEIYKYYTFESLILSFENGSIRFVEPSMWPDQYESRFYTAKYSKNFEYQPSLLYATCFTKRQYSESSWKVYTRNTGGLHSKCIQLSVDCCKLRNELINNAKHCFFYEGDANYHFDDDTINNLHVKGSLYHRCYFDNFCDDSFLRLMLIKRQAYAYEDELRIFLLPDLESCRNDHKNAKSEYIHISWAKVIKKILVDKDASEAELLSLKYAAKKAGIILINDEIKYTKQELDMKKMTHIELERFDIDNMALESELLIEK